MEHSHANDDSTTGHSSCSLARRQDVGAGLAALQDEAPSLYDLETKPGGIQIQTQRDTANSQAVSGKAPLRRFQTWKAKSFGTVLSSQPQDWQEDASWKEEKASF